MRSPVLGLCGLMLVAGLSAEAAEVDVRVSGIAHDKGAVRISLYDKPETFRKEPHALAVQTQPATPGSAAGRFKDLPPGRYALIVYHDENGNGDLDRFLGMIPTEGYGLSNNPVVSGPPSFDECAFDLEGGAAPMRVEIDLRY